MIVKFIVTKDESVYFGDRFYRNENHADIAFRFSVEKKMVAGGGLADINSKRIFGTSRLYGAYDPVKIKELLPDWQVEKPSYYDAAH